jgi:hypothetical protein
VAASDSDHRLVFQVTVECKVFFQHTLFAQRLQNQLQFRSGILSETSDGVRRYVRRGWLAPRHATTRVG